MSRWGISTASLGIFNLERIHVEMTSSKYQCYLQTSKWKLQYFLSSKIGSQADEKPHRATLMNSPLHQRLQLLRKASYLSNSHIQGDSLCQYTRHDTCKHEMYVSDHGDSTFLPNRMNVPFFLLCVSHMVLFCHTCCDVGTSSSLLENKNNDRPIIPWQPWLQPRFQVLSYSAPGDGVGEDLETRLL